MSITATACIEAALASMPRGKHGKQELISASLLHDLPAEACWPWQGYVDPKTGYGFATRQSKVTTAHRAVWAIFHGSPGALQVDHICHDPDTCAGGGTCEHRSCVNPGHLRAVTPRENALRSNSRAAVNARKTHCSKGHAYDDENTYHLHGQRICRACRRAADRRRYWEAMKEDRA